MVRSAPRSDGVAPGTPVVPGDDGTPPRSPTRDRARTSAARSVERQGRQADFRSGVDAELEVLEVEPFPDVLDPFESPVEAFDPPVDPVEVSAFVVDFVSEPPADAVSEDAGADPDPEDA